MVAAVRYGLDGACVGLALTQFGLVGILHLYGFDARTFTEFQILMLVLTATGLIVGVVVSERKNADRLIQEAEARLKEKEAEAAAGRTLQSGERNGLRAGARDQPADDGGARACPIRPAYPGHAGSGLASRGRQPDDPDRAHRSCRQRGRSHARFPPSWPSPHEHPRSANHAGRRVIAGTRTGLCAWHYHRARCGRRSAAGLRRPCPVAASGPQFRAQCGRGDHRGTSATAGSRSPRRGSPRPRE